MWFLESLDSIHRAIQGSSDLRAALSAALAVLLDVFACDRAWLLEAHGDTWTPMMERTRPEYPGALERGVKQPMTPETARRHRRVLERDRAVQLSAEEVAAIVVPEGVAPPRALLATAIRLKVGPPWILGLHQCTYARIWGAEEERLFVEIGHRLADTLSSHTNEQKLAQAQRVARLGYWERDVATFEVNYSDETYRIFGLAPGVDKLQPATLAERLHPDDRHIMLEAYERAIAGGPRYDVDYRVLRPDGEVRYVHSEADVTWDANGRPLRMFGTMQDITERKRAEEQLVRYRDALEELADEQAALRRVATLVARAASTEEIFSRVTEEAGRHLGVDLAALGRYDAVGETLVAGWSTSGSLEGLGRATELGGHNIATIVRRTGRPARIENYDEATGEVAAVRRRWGVRAIVGVPITVERELRGVMYAASTTDRPLPPSAEERLASFTELLATAFANAEAREALRRVADEQAALRRVATLVARGVAADRLFAAVAEEAGKVLPGAELTVIGRYLPHREIEYVGGWTPAGEPVGLGARMPLGGHNVSTRVYETSEAARIDHLDDDDAAPVSEVARRSQSRSSAGAPIKVEGKLWGVITVASSREVGLPSGIEHRVADFTELIATAIANTQAREELAASSARLVAAADETRRRIERDLHDGAQQHLISLVLDVRAVRARVPPAMAGLASQLDRVADDLARVVDELREFARGIHPSVLTHGGLRAALRALARRSAIPVELDLQLVQRAPEPIEIAAYYVISEALTNAVKHARASHVAITVAQSDGRLGIRVHDDGVGGAAFAGGSGLVGLKDRVEALGGYIELDSEPGAGTDLSVELPGRLTAATIGASR